MGKRSPISSSDEGNYSNEEQISKLVEEKKKLLDKVKKSKASPVKRKHSGVDSDTIFNHKNSFHSQEIQNSFGNSSKKKKKRIKEETPSDSEVILNHSTTENVNELFHKVKVKKEKKKKPDAPDSLVIFPKHKYKERIEDFSEDGENIIQNSFEKSMKKKKKKKDASSQLNEINHKSPKKRVQEPYEDEKTINHSKKNANHTPNKHKNETSDEEESPDQNVTVKKENRTSFGLPSPGKDNSFLNNLNQHSTPYKKETNSSEDSESDSLSDDDEPVSQNNSQSTLNNIKTEELSELDSEAELNRRRSNNSSLSNKISPAVKSEVQTKSSSDSDDNDEEASTSQSQSKRELGENNVTILQDIRLVPQSKTPKERLEEMYPRLKKIEIPIALNISDSDEVYLFRIPKNVDPKQLKNVEINLEDMCKINIGEKYIITPTNKMPHPSLVVSTDSKVLKFQNNFKMEKYIKSKEEPNITVPERRSMPLPENLKNRHPLFGSDFHQKIQLSEHVEKKLDDAIASFLKKQKKKAKKKKEKRHRT